MNNYLYLLTFLFSGFCWGQTAYHPIPETNSTWIQAEFLYGGLHEHETITSVVYTLGDTTINGQDYVVFGSHGIVDWIDGYGSQSQISGTDYMTYGTGYFRQDIPQKKVFLWNPANQSDDLLYDFGNLIIGQPYPETHANLNYPNLLVMGQDSVQLMDGNYYKRWALGTNSSDSAYVSVIEGVGGTNGFNTPIYPVFEQSSHLLCHKAIDQHVFEDWQTSILPPRYSEDCSSTLSVHSPVEINFEIYPNPTSSMVAIRSGQKARSIAVYGLDGQLLIHQELANNGQEFNIDLSSLQQGSYLLQLTSADGYSAAKQVQLIK